MIPVNDQEIKTHTEDAIENLHAVEHFLDRLVVGVVVDLILVLIALARVLEDSLKVAIVNHGHGSMTIGITTVSVELVHGILQPSIALLFQNISVHENVVEHNANLEELQCIQ